MTPAPVLDDVCAQVHSLILVSGTLAPLSSAELGSGFATNLASQMLLAPHVIGRPQLLVPLITKFKDGTPIKCNYEMLQKDSHLLEIGNLIVSFVAYIPCGVLVFLPSYTLLERCLKVWKQPLQFIENRQKNSKVVVIEPKGTGDEFQFQREKFERNAKQGALLLAVYRGKMSEGISFNDHFARGVVCLGIPYPPSKGPEIVQKRRFNDMRLRASHNKTIAASASSAANSNSNQSANQNGDLSGLLSGDAWYGQQAFRAVSQALGRCVRHPKDYGTILMIDSRWGEKSNYKKLPAWIQHFLQLPTDCKAALVAVNNHFQNPNSYCQQQGRLNNSS